MKLKKMLCVLMTLCVLLSGIMCCSFSASAEDFRFSDEYKTSPFYTALTEAIENSGDKTMMEKTLAVALSQEGYKNYATDGADLDQARADGLLWTGKELRMNSSDTGNTEYTRWAQRYVMNRAESTQYLDCDWCAIFASWCMYQAGYYSEEALKRCYYSYYANPSVSYDADGWILAFNLDQRRVWYTPTAVDFLEKNNWNTYYNTDTDPFEIDYKPGGLVFFTWDGVPGGIDHVAIVVDYDKDTHVLTYTNGNSDGMVITRQIDLDETEEFRGQALAKNSARIAAYGEYDKILPLEKKTITSEVKEIVWDLSSSSGIKVQTDSESKVCSVYVDRSYLGSTIESNMVLLEGRMAIGRSEMKKISVGEHTMTLTFDDGDLSIPLKITDGPDEPEPVTETTSATVPTTEPATDATSATQAPTEPVTDATCATVPATEPVAKEKKTTVTLSKSSVKLYTKATYTIKATVKNPKGKTAYTSSDKKVATVSASGKIKALKKGTAYITVKNNGVSKKLKLTVKNPSLKKSSAVIGKNKTVKINVKGSGKFTFKSTNKKVAAVSSKGVVRGRSKGKAYIKVKANGKTLKFKVTVS